MFYWPISSPFAILRVDFWIPGGHTDTNECMNLVNLMCDMIKFVVVVPVPDEPSVTLASYFMQHVLLKIGLYRIVVLEYNTF